MALARSELDVDIDIKPDDLFPGASDDDRNGGNGKRRDEAKKDAVSATFTYRDREGGREVKGTMVYARNVMTGEVPWDVKAYHETDPTFPHNSTADQLYTDQKFEGYRVLGERAGKHAAELMRNRGLMS